MKLIKKKEFISTTFNPEYKAFVIYIAIFKSSSNSGNKIYSLKMAQIAYLKVDKALIEISNKYTNFTYIFLPKLVIELLKHTEINNYVIELIIML